MRRTISDVFDPPTIELRVSGTVTPDEKADARQVIAGTLAVSGHPVEDARVRLTQHRGPAPFTVAQANVTVAERLVRAQASAPTAAEAIDRIAARLSHRLGLLGRYLRVAEAGRPDPARPYLLAALPASPWPWRPAVPRGLVRSKIVPLAVQNPDAAALTMTLRDYDFHLFTDDDTGTETVVHRDRAGGHSVIRVAGSPLRRAPVVPLPEAIERLNASPARRCSFFADPVTGRGRVLYRRYDGHLGLITPAW